jgi:hypothetical protein
VTNISTLVLTNVQPAQAGNYFVTVTNVFGFATSSVAVLSVYPSAAAVLNAPAAISGNQFQFDVNGVPGFGYAVQASTDMMNWVTLLTNASPFVFSETNAISFPQRYYRTVFLP